MDSPVRLASSRTAWRRSNRGSSGSIRGSLASRRQESTCFPGVFPTPTQGHHLPFDEHEIRHARARLHLLTNTKHRTQSSRSGNISTARNQRTRRRHPPTNFNRTCNAHRATHTLLCTTPPFLYPSHECTRIRSHHMSAPASRERLRHHLDQVAGHELDASDGLPDAVAEAQRRDGGRGGDERVERVPGGMVVVAR